MDEFSLKEAPELFCNYIDILFTLREQQDVFFTFFGYDEDSEVFEILQKNNKIEEAAFKSLRNLCGRIRRLLISSVKTLKSK